MNRSRLSSGSSTSPKDEPTPQNGRSKSLSLKQSSKENPTQEKNDPSFGMNPTPKDQKESSKSSPEIAQDIILSNPEMPKETKNTDFSFENAPEKILISQEEKENTLQENLEPEIKVINDDVPEENKDGAISEEIQINILAKNEASQVQQTQTTLLKKAMIKKDNRKIKIMSGVQKKISSSCREKIEEIQKINKENMKINKLTFDKNFKCAECQKDVKSDEKEMIATLGCTHKVHKVWQY